MKEITINEDIYSNINTKKCYAKKGDKVILVGISGNVLIVERKDKFRFPIAKELTNFDKINIANHDK